MKEYKLIKKYPGLPKDWEVGMVVGTGDRQGLACFSPCSGEYTDKHIDHNDVINNPEFWEEVIEKTKEYEILSFRAIRDMRCTINKGTIVHRTEYGNFKNIETYPNISSEEQHLLNNPNWEIHSVRRLSDGEVFTVGDVCEFGKITKIFITEGGYCMTATPTSGYSCNIMYLKKTKPVLFTTEDGVDIREGDDCYITWNYKFGEPIYPEICKLNWEVFFRMADDNVYFSTREKAEEYILLNKPCLSINDIKKTGSIGESFGNIGAYLNITELEKLVKSRL